MSKSPPTNDPSRELLGALMQVELDGMTFVQLQRLKTALNDTLELVTAECDKRRDGDDDGDTTIQVLVSDD